MIMILRRPVTPAEALYYKVFSGVCEVDYPDTLEENIKVVKSRFDKEAQDVCSFYFRYRLMNMVELDRFNNTARALGIEIRLVKNAVCRIDRLCSWGCNKWILMHGHVFNNTDFMKNPYADIQYVDLPNRVCNLLCRHGITNVSELKNRREYIKKRETKATYLQIEAMCLRIGIWED